MIGRPKLRDEEATCNIIKAKRRYDKTYIKKIIPLHLNIDDNKIVCRTHVVYNPHTGHVSEAHSIQCKSLEIYPTTHQKLKCTNEHALNMLKKARLLEKKRKSKKG